MKKNWFLTKNNCILDLNRYVGFYFDPVTEMVLGVKDEGGDTPMGKFETLQEAKDYLNEIYHQLWEEELRVYDDNGSRVAIQKDMENQLYRSFPELREKNDITD